jgi:hypothetical protein
MSGIETSPEELAYWLGQFEVSGADDVDEANPFPPGYADDLLQDESD